MIHFVAFIAGTPENAWSGHGGSSSASDFASGNRLGSCLIAEVAIDELLSVTRTA
jgi:hypothetical protein